MANNPENTIKQQRRNYAVTYFYGRSIFDDTVFTTYVE